MSIKHFIQTQILKPRLQGKQVLVVYDPEVRLRSLCQDMESDSLKVIDASESSIESREEALNALRALGNHELEQMLVYVPVKKPLEEEEKQRDPFALYMACGAVFPEGDGDTYKSICLKAKPDHATEIREVFDQDPNPDFSVIDAIGGGLKWPNLRALLDTESTRDILFTILCPSDQKKSALLESDNWVSEAKNLFKQALGFSLKTRSKAWSAISDELWRYLLFSEFVFDLPVSLPDSLQTIPHANNPAQPLMEDLCERLRNDRRTRNYYIEQAERVEEELSLVSQCSEINDLGIKDTFPFEERTFLKKAIKAITTDQLDDFREILSRHSDSVWTSKGENQIQWDFLASALKLIETCQDNNRSLSDHTSSQEDLIQFYVTQLREIDRYHREFEQAVSDYSWQDPNGMLMPVQEYARGCYRDLADKIQLVFTRHLKEVGWPLTGLSANNETFDDYVAPKLEQGGNRVAYIMVDALRYELGLALEKQLSEDNQVTITPSLTQLPTITPVGMASLLPGASSNLEIKKEEDSFTIKLGEKNIKNVSHRMDVFKQKYGQRFQEGRLEEFVRDRFEVNSDTDLLVLRSVEIDAHFENNPDTAPNEIINALKRIRMTIFRLKELGFTDVVIATDHGFFMNVGAGPGDTCAKPEGNWVNVHDRSLLGAGNSDSTHFSLSTERAGIKSDFQTLAGPLTLASYRKGLFYFHGGCSLQECIVPVIQITLGSSDSTSQDKEVAVTLNYKSGAKRITTRLPVVEIYASTNDLFDAENELEVIIEAQDSKGNVVGEAKTGGIVDPATGVVSLKYGKYEKVTMKMNLEFEGDFKLKAMDPKTMLVYDQLDLETDYTV